MELKEAAPVAEFSVFSGQSAMTLASYSGKSYKKRQTMPIETPATPK
jgi:hypothetical protein